jgi:hypothetical protein
MGKDIIFKAEKKGRERSDFFQNISHGAMPWREN